MFLVNSRYRRFPEAPKCFRGKLLHTPGRTFSRSYGANLPSSLTRVLSSALGFSPHLPELVCGTVTISSLRPEAFPGSMESTTQTVRRLSSLSPLGVAPAFFSYRDRLLAYTGTTNRRLAYPSPSPLRSKWWHGNINPFSIAYAFRPRLRTG